MSKCLAYVFCDKKECSKFHFKNSKWEDRMLFGLVKEKIWEEISAEIEEPKGRVSWLGNDEMRRMPIPRKYEDSYKVWPSCGLRHDSQFIGRDECLTDEECKLINLTTEQIEERNNIVKYYKLYQKDRDILGLTTIYE